MNGAAALQSEPVRDGSVQLVQEKMRSNVMEVYKLMLDYSFIKSHNTWTEGTH